MKIRKSQKRWIAKMLVLVMLITCLPMTQKQEARAAGNPYGKWQDVNRNGRQEVRCTWFAWQRAYDLTGVALPGWRINF